MLEDASQFLTSEYVLRVPNFMGSNRLVGMLVRLLHILDIMLATEGPWTSQLPHLCESDP